MIAVIAGVKYCAASRGNSYRYYCYCGRAVNYVGDIHECPADVSDIFSDDS